MATRHPGSGSRNVERGFTFIEILVVMGIIAVLAGLTIVAMNLIIRRGPEIKSETIVKETYAIVQQWKQRFERFPPSEASRLRKIAGGEEGLPSMPDGFNVGIEVLYQALHWPTFGGGGSIKDDSLGNTDEDEFSKPSPAGGSTPWEIIDGWGNPLVYFVHTDYVRAEASPPSYILKDGTEVTPRPWRFEKEGRGFAESRGVQIYSMGEDGQPNTDDDIKSWE